MQVKLLWFVVVLQFLVDLRVSSQDPDDLCGERIFTQQNGTINFTGLRFAASRNSTCNYRIEVGEDNFVSLKFLYFDLPTYLDFCNHNWMTLSCISDEVSDTLTRKSPLLCGQTKWSSALKLSECPVLSVEIVFSSDLIFDRKGFQLQYEISPTVRSNASDENEIPEIGCGETFLTNQTGAIVLPNNPNITRAKLNCTYTISPSEPDTLISLLTLDVSYIDLLTLTDDIDGCVQDHLQIRCSDEDEQDSDSSDCGIFSSDSLASPVYRGCLTLQITLQSDSYDPRETRLIKYDMTVEYEDDNIFDYGGNDDCGNSTYRGQTGILTSPRFPLVHPHNMNCTYRIAVGRQNVLSLKFLTFSLEDSGGGFCGYDWIRIACVLNSAPNFLTATKLCGHVRPGDLRYWNCSSVYLQFITDSSVQYGGFKIQYSLEHKDSVNITEIECGQTEFNTSDGVITLPSNPSGYISQVNCRYHLLANDTSNFHLNISSLNLTKIYLKLGRCIQPLCQGENAMPPINLCSRYIYSFNPEVILHNCQSLEIPIVSSYFELQESYQIPFKVIPSDAICGERSLTHSNGAISFPSFGSSYYPNTMCNYTIHGGNNTTISIAFNRSQYQYPNYRYCYDKITMFCLNSPNWNPYAGRRFCSQLRWPLVMRFFNCSALLIAFSSLSYSANTIGFRLNYTVSMGEIKDAAEAIPEIPCGSSFSSMYGTIALPFQGAMPIASINCVYNISLKFINKGSILLNLGYAFARSSDSREFNFTMLCLSDDVSAEINGTKSLTFGADDRPWTIIESIFSGCDSVQLSIQSSAYYSVEQRYLYFKIRNTECGNVSFDGSIGNVKSPLFPLPYEKGLECAYYIEVGDENFITLQFLTFSLYGFSRDTPVLQSYDYHYSYQSNDYKFGEDRSTYVYRHDSCYSDHLTIRCLFNGSFIRSDQKYLNRPLCGDKSTTARIYGCQALRLEFITGDGSYRRMSGFNIHYHIQHDNSSDVHCGNNSFNDPSGEITSPGYPDHYPNGLNCTYAIKAGQNKSALIEVSFFDLQPVSYRYVDGIPLYECNRDWLELSCSSEDATIANQLRNRRFCGHQRPFTVLLRGCEHVIIYFNTDSTVALDGFRIKYKIYSGDEECGNTVFSNSTGIITSPGYPGPYPHRINCTYYIEVGSNNSLSLQFYSFDVGYVYGHYYYSHWPSLCLNDWIRITCSSPDSTGPPFTSQYLNKKLCAKKYSFSTKFKRCNQYAVEFFSGGNYSKSGFLFHYKINKSEDECGRTEFSNSTGVITSPGFPAYYGPNLNCTYYIDIGNNLLSLNFLRFDIEGYHHHYHYSQYCPNDWLKITCISRRTNASILTTENINTKLCGQRYYLIVTLDGCSRAAIQFFTTESQHRTGFKIQYELTKSGYCGYSSNNFTDAEGTIVSPSLLLGRQLPPTTCNCLISAQQMSTISLAITAMTASVSCIANWLSIKCLDNGNSLSYSPMVCGARYLYAKVVLPSCSSVQVIYPSTNSAIHFVISYRIAGPEEVCGKSLFTEPTGYISFPKFSPTYKTKFNCSYSVSVGIYNSISFELSSFVDNDENNETSPNDWISIFCRGNNDNGQNRITHNSIQSMQRMTPSFTNCSTVDIVFHSENQATRRRFNVSYTIRSNYITTKLSSPTSSSATTRSSIARTTSSATTSSSSARTTSSASTSSSSAKTTSSSSTTIFSSTSKSKCPKECIIYLNKTVFECPTNPSDQATTEPWAQAPQAQRFVKTGSFGALIGFIVLLIVASLVALTVVWLRKRGAKPKEDEDTLTLGDSDFENPDSQGKWRRGGFNLWSFIPFRSKNRGNTGRQRGFVHLEPMDSSVSRAYSEQSIQSNPYVVSNDRDPILE